jgi:hypothetical protein
MCVRCLPVCLPERRAREKQHFKKLPERMRNDKQIYILLIDLKSDTEIPQFSHVERQARHKPWSRKNIFQY